MPTRAQRTICSRHGCGKVARYQAVRTEAVFCPRHASEICGISVLREIDPSHFAEESIVHGTANGYQKEIRLGVQPCDDCRRAMRTYRATLRESKGVAV